MYFKCINLLLFKSVKKCRHPLTWKQRSTNHYEMNLVKYYLKMRSLNYQQAEASERILKNNDNKCLENKPGELQERDSGVHPLMIVEGLER